MFKSLEAKGGKFIRGQLVLVAAAPGSGKSAFVLTQALASKVPTLYVSADSDGFTQLTRSICILTGRALDDAEKMVLEGKDHVIDDILSLAPIRFTYNASPTLDDIELSMQAYEEMYGDYPAMVVIDNVTNVRSGADDDPFSGLESLMDFLHSMGRETGACVVGLHHVTGPFNDADKPIPLSGVKGQIARVPEVVMTLHRPTEESIGVSVVKNRGGRADPSGQDFAELRFQGELMRIQDY